MALAAVRSKALVLLLFVTPIVGSVIDLCFVVSYFVSTLVLQSSQLGRDSWLFVLFVFLLYRDCCVTLPHDVTGLSAVCDCGIS